MSSKKHSALLRMMGALFAVLGISFIPTVIIALIYGEYLLWRYNGSVRHSRAYFDEIFQSK